MYLPYLYDLILVLAVLLLVRRGWRSGLLASLLRLLGWVVALALVLKFSLSVATWLFDNYMASYVSSVVAKAIPADLISDLQSGVLAAQDAIVALQEVIDSLSGFLGAQTVDFSGAESILALVQEKGLDLADTITQTILRPVVVPLVRALISLVVFVLSLGLFNALARWSARHHRRQGHGMAGGVNGVLGALAGLIEAIALAYLYALILSALAGVLQQDFLNPAVYDKTLLVSLLVK